MKFKILERPALLKIRLEPAMQVMKFGKQLPLKVIAEFSNGEKKDVTWLSVFHSNDTSMANVADDGTVTIGDMVGQTSVMARYLGKVAVFQSIIPRPGTTVAYPKLPENNFIDGLVDRHLKRLNITPSEMADNATFQRRAYLDIIGKLPTADEASKFSKI